MSENRPNDWRAEGKKEIWARHSVNISNEQIMDE